ncbi:hypothetical protein H4R24_000411 [Coemansia sp. RSA 988]|nr:hypothetical protein H4R24_000411 [Coemansia sp. RSA 988]
MTMIEVGKQPFNSAVVGKQDTPTTEANQTSKPRRVARPRNLPRETKSNTTQTSKPAARHPAPTQEDSDGTNDTVKGGDRINCGASVCANDRVTTRSGITPKAEIVAAPTIDPVTTPDAKEEPVLGIEAKPAPTAVPISAAAQAPITELTPVAVGDPAPESEPETISKSGTHDGIKVPTLEQSSAHTAPSFPNGTCGRDSIQSNSQSSKLVVGADVGAALEALEAKHAQLCTRKKDIILEMLADQEKAEEEYNAALKQALEKKQEILVKNTERMKAIDNEISANHKEIDAATAKADHILRSAVHPRIVMLLEARAASVANNIASKQTSK